MGCARLLGRGPIGYSHCFSFRSGLWPGPDPTALWTVANSIPGMIRSFHVSGAKKKTQNGMGFTVVAPSLPLRSKGRKETLVRGKYYFSDIKQIVSAVKAFRKNPAPKPGAFKIPHKNTGVKNMGISKPGPPFSTAARQSPPHCSRLPLFPCGAGPRIPVQAG